MNRFLMPPFVPLSLLLLIASALSAQAEWKAGTEALQEGRYDDAIRELEETTAVHPDHAAGHYMLGLAFHKVERLSESIASLRRAHGLAPEHAGYAQALAQSLGRGKRPDDALDILARYDLSALNPNLMPSFVATLAAAASNADPTKALPLLRRAVTQHSTSPDLWLTLGNAVSQSGNQEEAFHAYERAFRLDSSRKPLGRRAMSSALGLAQNQASTGGGLAWYRRAAELGEELTLENLGGSGRLLPGEAWLKAGDPNAAQTWFKKALGDQPGDPAAEFGLARAQLELGDGMLALQTLKRALEASPDKDLFASIQRRLGYTYHQLEQYKKAADAYLLGEELEKANEMMKYQKIASENLSIDHRRKECQTKAAHIAGIKAERKGTFPAHEWAAIERDLDLSLSDCRPYLDAG